MKQNKLVIAIASLVGLISMFALPYISIEGLSMKYWDFHKLPASITEGALNGPHQVYIALVGIGVPLLLALIAMATKQLQRWQAVLSGLFFLVAFACEGVHKGFASDHGVSTALGAKLLFLSVAVGFLASVIGTFKAEPAPR